MFAFVFSCFYHLPIVAYFIANLLQWIVVSSTVNFFMSFHIANSDDKVRSNRVIGSNHVRQYATNQEYS